MASGGVDFGPCAPEERPEALDLLYRRASEDLRASLVAEALAASCRGELELGGLWAARRRGRIVGALLTQPLAGRAAGVWPPEVSGAWGRHSLAAGLVRAAAEGLRARGVRLLQALLDPALPRSAGAALAAGGLPRITELVYLTRPTAPPLGLPPGAPRLSWSGFEAVQEPHFRATLAATYEGTFDMPELAGVRSLDDVLDGHRASGRFDPGRWRLGRLSASDGGAPEPVAILLIADQPERPSWEVTYLGLVPSARGRGLGRAALAHALELAAPCQERLDLAVDVRNAPAVRLYQAAGFRPYARRAVHLAILGGAEGRLGGG